MSRRHWGGLLVSISTLVTMSACTSDSSGVPSVKTADAYAAAIRWYLAEPAQQPVDTTDTGPLIVYVAPESGKAIGSQTQASVVAEMADMHDAVTVRFADVRDDAIDVETDTQPVKDDGVLLLVGPVTEGPAPVDVSVAVYRDVDDTHAFVMTITTAGDSFRATSVSEVAQG